MDANGQRFWLLADADHWRWRQRVRYDATCGVLRLAGLRRLPPPRDAAAAHATANTALERIPRAVDAAGGVAYWHSAEGAVVTRSHLPGEAVRLPLPAAPTDLIVGADGILYLAVLGGVRLHDLRGRWDDVLVETGGLEPWRLCAAPAGGVWVMERTSGRLGRIQGRPREPVPPDTYAGTTFRPDPENCDPPRFELVVPEGLDPGERAVAIASNEEGWPALLTWVGSDGEVRLRPWSEEQGRPGAALALEGARYAYAVEFVRSGRIVVRVPGLRDAPAFALDDADSDDVLEPAGEVNPLDESAIEAPFAHRVRGPVRYPLLLEEDGVGVRPLHPLSFGSLATRGEVRAFDEDGGRLLDSGDPATVWHRLYAEARIPPGSGFVVWCAATDEPIPPDPEAPDEWLPHRFGDPPPTNLRVPAAAWESAASELPHHPGLGPWRRERGRAGLWSVLLQDMRRRVRRVVGRYLWVRVTLHGDGRAGPEIAALRVWENRFSYRDRYLPRLYREREFVDDAGGLEPSDATPASTPADFLERFLANIEGMLTPLEDRIAAAHLLMHPEAAPEESLEWLAGWIGVAFDPVLPAPRRRRWLAAAPEMARFHGTRRGLELALEVASAGAVSRGEIVVIEDFRLRRLLATLLGVDLVGEPDPLLPGLVVSGNSVVGDTLVLGEAERAELLALFRGSAASEEENRAVIDFHDRLAHRATVLVHAAADELDPGLLRRVVELESPAHAEVRLSLIHI